MTPWRPSSATPTATRSATVPPRRLADGPILASVLGGLVMARLGFAMHSGNHAAVGRRSRANAAVGTLMDLIGGSSTVWQATHQVSHHGKPNVSGQRRMAVTLARAKNINEARAKAHRAAKAIQIRL